MLQCVAVCCSVLQCVAVEAGSEGGRDTRGVCVRLVSICCKVLQSVAVCCSVLQCVAVCCSGLECVGDLYCVPQRKRAAA